MLSGIICPSVRAASFWLLAALLIVALAACAQAGSANIPTASQSQGAAPADTNPAPAADQEGTVADIPSAEAAAVDTDPAAVDPATVGEEDAALAYARCIRANGYPQWPDPTAEGQIMITRDAGIRMDDPKLQAAMEACQDLRPAGAGGGGAMMGAGGMAGAGGFADEEQALAFARCMRENGVPDFPDPNPDSGGVRIVTREGSEGGLNPNDPRFQAAMQTCRASILEGSGE
jgi:hypothetical protein